MEEQKTPVKVLLERGEAYIKTSIQLLKYKGTDKLAEIVSNLASGFVIMLLVALLFVNLNVGIALLIGDLLGRIWLGFVVLAGLYGGAGFLVYLFRDRWIRKPVSNAVIQQLIQEEPVNETGAPNS